MNFNAMLRRLGNGRTMDDLENALMEVVQAVRHTGADGEITLKIKVEWPKKADPEVSSVVLYPEVKVKAPKPGRPGMVAFIRADGVSLQTRDPRQPELPGMPEDADAPATPAERLAVVGGECVAAGGA